MPKETPPENLLQAKVVFFIPKVIRRKGTQKF
jgi:hypothetical protein